MFRRVSRPFGIDTSEGFFQTLVFALGQQNEYLRKSLRLARRFFLPAFLSTISTWSTVAKTEHLIPQREIDPSEVQKLDSLSNSTLRPRDLRIDNLDDRIAMLLDGRANVSLMKRDLSELLQVLRTNR